MATAVDGVFREELRDAILHSKILVVGAGGIGCEILKNLVMSGFADIEIVSYSSVIVNVTSLSNNLHVRYTPGVTLRKRFTPTVTISKHLCFVFLTFILTM